MPAERPRAVVGERGGDGGRDRAAGGASAARCGGNGGCYRGVGLGRGVGDAAEGRGAGRGQAWPSGGRARVGRGRARRKGARRSQTDGRSQCTSRRHRWCESRRRGQAAGGGEGNHRRQSACGCVGWRNRCDCAGVGRLRCAATVWFGAPQQSAVVVAGNIVVNRKGRRQGTHCITSVPPVVRRVVGGTPTGKVKSRAIAPNGARRHTHRPVADGDVIDRTARLGGAADGRCAALVVVFLERVTGPGVAIFGGEIQAPGNIAQRGLACIADLHVKGCLRIGIRVATLDFDLQTGTGRVAGGQRESLGRRESLGWCIAGRQCRAAGGNGRSIRRGRAAGVNVKVVELRLVPAVGSNASLSIACAAIGQIGNRSATNHRLDVRTVEDQLQRSPGVSSV